MKKKEASMPPRFESGERYLSLHWLAARIISDFYEYILPALRRIGWADDSHIKKYLATQSLSDIYRDAIAESRIQLYEQVFDSVNATAKDGSLELGEDFYKPFRAHDCDVSTPTEPGFEFLELPYIGDKKLVIQALAVKDGSIMIDDTILRDASCLRPLQDRWENFLFIRQFCEEINKRYPGPKHIRNFVKVGDNGNLKPNEDILFGPSIYGYKLIEEEE